MDDAWPADSVRAVIALGSNLGDREATLRAAVRDLDRLEGVTVERVSSLYETAALRTDGVHPEAPAYLNAAAIIRTTLDPHGLLAALHSIENAHGRTREIRWGDRTLDLDIITFANLAINEEELTVPHPAASTRAFVLAPWLEIDPTAELPGAGPVAGLLGATGDHPRRFAPMGEREWSK